jgi:hypothetical protein
VTDPEGLEIIDRRGRYALVAGEDFVGVWDFGEPGGLLARFEESEDALHAAERRFAEIRRGQRTLRLAGASVRLLLAVVVLGGSLWILGGLVSALTFTPGVRIPQAVQGISFFVDEVGFRLAVGALIMLAAVQVSRGAFRVRGEATERRRGFERFLLWTAAVGLVVWAGSAIAVPLLTPAPIDVPTGLVTISRPRLSVWVFIATTVEAVAFRAWVAALVLLAISMVRGEPAEGPPEGASPRAT